MVETIRQHESIARRIIEGGISAANGWEEVTGTITSDRTALGKQAPAVRGLYAFLSATGEVLYIGSSLNIRHRITTHNAYWDLLEAQASVLAYLPLPDYADSQIRRLEASCLQMHKPRLSRCWREEWSSGPPRRTAADLGIELRRGPKAKREGAVRGKMLSARVADDVYAALELLTERCGKTKADVLEDLILKAASKKARVKQ